MKFITSKTAVFLLGFIMMLILGVVDYITGYEISFSFFYLIPVCMVSWICGFSSGLAISFLCMTSWYVCDVASGNVYSNQIIAYWNGIMRGLIFSLASFLTFKISDIMRKLSVAEQKAINASHAKSMFLSNMSHEIRTPMNALVGVTDLLLQTSLGKDQKEYVEIYKKEGEHLLRLINDILDLSKIEANKFEMELVAFDLKQSVEEVISIMGMRAREKGLEFTHIIVPDVPRFVISAPHCLRRILINLVGNSIKFTETGHVSLNVSMNSGSVREILFAIEDTGIGIPADRIPSLFTPFEQADDTISRKYGGTGLGLSISQKLLDMMGRKIQIQSRLGEGSIFTFAIPFDIPSAEQANELERLNGKRKQASDASPDTRPLQVLIVDDYETNRMLIKSFLKKTPYKIDEAENGKEAFDKFRAGKYSIVLMDIQMPVMDGYAATGMIRKWEIENSATPTPIIALTAFAYKEDADKAKVAGCDMHLPKPIDMPGLLRVIQEMGVFNEERLEIGGTRTKNKVSVDIDLKEITERFLSDVQTFIAEIDQGIESGDFDKVRGIGHKLKGIGGSFGFPFISEVGEIVEHSAQTKDGESLKEQHRALVEYMNITEVFYE